MKNDAGLPAVNGLALLMARKVPHSKRTKEAELRVWKLLLKPLAIRAGIAGNNCIPVLDRMLENAEPFEECVFKRNFALVF